MCCRASSYVSSDKLVGDQNGFLVSVSIVKLAFGVMSSSVFLGSLGIFWAGAFGAGIDSPLGAGAAMVPPQPLPQPPPQPLSQQLSQQQLLWWNRPRRRPDQLWPQP